MKARRTSVALAAIVILVAACSNTTSSTAPSTAPSVAPPPSTAPSSEPSSSAAASGGAPAVGIGDFDLAFTAMAQFKALTTAGSGMVGVLLPDTTTSARYVSFDAPYLKQAFDAAGYAATDYKIDNAQASDATQLAQAQADITAGAKVLIMDPLNATVGKKIQTLAQTAGVTLISYDRATFQGTNTYYVSFDNVQVGKLIGQGFTQCLTDWAIASPKVFTLDGGQDTDPNAIDFAKGYNSVIWGQEKTPLAAGTTNAGATLVAEMIAPGWNNTQGGTIFQQQYTAHKDINATVEANDGLANAVIGVLKTAGVPAKKIPTTGQDATLQGMAWTLQDYQCGSVYKPIYLEAQAAVALATILRAGGTPPTTLVNGSTTDPTNSSVTEPAVLLVPTWVNKANMQATVITDKFVSGADLCKSVGAAVCTANGITQ